MWILPKQLITYPYVLGTQELISDLNEQSQACEQSLLVKSKPMRALIWLRKWKKDSWTQHLSGRILKPSLGAAFVERWIYCQADTLASPFLHVEKDLEQKTKDICGLTLQMEFEQCNQVSVSSKMLKDTSALDSEKSLAIWNALVTNQRGEYLARQKLALRTEENESLFWPTPRAGNPGSRPNGKGGKILAEEVKKYSTPTARMWKDTGTMPAEFRRKTPSLAIQVGGKVNADWVEWLMGIPTGWTDCDCAATALFQQLPH